MATKREPAIDRDLLMLNDSTSRSRLGRWSLWRLREEVATIRERVDGTYLVRLASGERATLATLSAAAEWVQEQVGA